FAAGISPVRPAGRISRERYARLADEVKRVLDHSITRGGTTLRDFISPDGAPGYFEQELAVYGRGGLPCPACGRPLRQAAVGQRATAWCGPCQRGPPLSGRRVAARARMERYSPDNCDGGHRMSGTAEITQLLDAARDGDRGALDSVLATLYQELHTMARRQLAGQRGQTLDATALVHEAYLKLAGRREARFDDRAHFFAYAAS